MSFAIAQAKFSGPLQLLLELIEQEELPITEVSLAQVTDDFLAYLDRTKVPTEELADFLVVATKLLYLKSRAILPNLPPDETVDASSLALQLRMYQEFVAAAAKIEALFASPVYLFAREKVALPPAPAFSPPPEVTPFSLQESFARLLKRLEPFFLLRQESIKRVVSVTQRIEEIRGAIVARAELTFREVVRGAKSKVDVVVSFLALLELVKQKIVRVMQKDRLQDITITRAE